MAIPKKAPAKGTIKINPANKGKYTARAKAGGHTVQQQARIDLAPGSKASPTVKKEANFVRNARKFKH